MKIKYQEAKESLQQALNDKGTIAHYQEKILTPAGERINDLDNPPSEEELQEILKSINEEIPEIIKNPSNYARNKVEVPSNFSAAQTYTGESGINAPEIHAHFDMARLDIPNLDGPSPSVTANPTPEGNG